MSYLYKIIKQWLQCLGEPNLELWQMELPTIDYPQQANGHDCGIFLMALAKYLMFGMVLTGNNF